jgi:glucose/arabinose dehydrogenase
MPPISSSRSTTGTPSSRRAAWTFYTLPQGDEMFPEWSGDLLIAGLQAGAVVRLSIEDGRVTEEERLVRGIGRVRDVAIDTNGSVLFVTDAPMAGSTRLSRN